MRNYPNGCRLVYLVHQVLRDHLMTKGIHGLGHHARALSSLEAVRHKAG